MITQVFIFILLTATVFSQTEILTNTEIVKMTRAGLSEELIILKVKGSKADYNTTADGLIGLKKEGVSDKVIKLLLEIKQTDKMGGTTNNIPYSDSLPAMTRDSFYKVPAKPATRIVLDKKEALRGAKTIAIFKSSLQPSRQALEKELMKRKDWQALKLNIVRRKENADLYIEIGYVSLSWLTHRYVYRIYDNKSGTVILAGETTSWGSLAKNLARGISKRLAKAFNNS